jgi:hypothetical protein
MYSIWKITEFQNSQIIAVKKKEKAKNIYLILYMYNNLVSQCMYGMNSETTEQILIKLWNYL